MKQIQLLKHTLSRRVRFILLLLFLSSNSIAYDLSPSDISEPEGTVIQLYLVIHANDFYENPVGSEICTSYEYIVRFRFFGESGSAQFSSSSSSGDLHLEDEGNPVIQGSSFWLCTNSPSTSTKTWFTVVLHDDEISESEESASLELLKLDSLGEESLVSTIDISIQDGQIGPPPEVLIDWAVSVTNVSPTTLFPLDDSLSITAVGVRTVEPPDAVILGGWDMAFLLSSDSQISLSDTVLESRSFSDFSSGFTETWTGNLDVEPGLYWVGACSTQADSNPSNDCSAGTQVEVMGNEPPPPPDLVVTGVDVDKTSLTSGDSLFVTTSISNLGGAATEGSTIRIYLSTDDVPSETDQQIATASLPALGTEETWQDSGAITVSIDPGSYYVVVCVDAIFDELDVSNNCALGPQIMVESGNAVCASQSLGCGQSRLGSLTAEDCTSGPQGPGFNAEKLTYAGQAGDTLFLDASWGFDGYLLLEGPNGLIVAQNDNHTGTGNSRIEHEATQNGTYTVWATTYAPGAGGSFEVSLSCQSLPGPDLTVDAPNTGLGSLVPGQSLNVATTLRNLGDQGADSTTLRYVLSSDNQIDLSDAQMGSDGAPAVAAFGSSAHSLSFTAPATPGSYYLGVCADVVAGESSASNNCSPGTRITVNERPDCVRHSLACGQLLSGGLSASDCTSSPRGDGFLAEVLEFNVTSGSELVIDAGWQGLDGYLYLEGPSGAVVAQNDDGGAGSRIEYEAVQGGVHRLWTTGFQRNASGSYSVDLLCGSSSAPDLQTSAATVDVSELSINQMLGISATVVNDGNLGAAATNVNFMLSNNETITPSDVVLASSGFAALSAGASRSVQATVEAPSLPGNYWVGVCVAPVSGETLTENNCSNISEVASISALQQTTQAGKSQPQGSKKKGTLIIVSNGINCLQNTISCGQTRSGTLSSQSGCDLGPRGTGYISDLYTFNGAAGDTASLNVSWDGVDGYLYLENPQGQVSGENDDFGSHTQSRHEQVLEHTGKYRVWPTAFEKGKHGNYQLTLTCNAPSAPDLVVETPQVSDSQVRPGQSVTVSTNARNTGSAGAQATSVEFVLSKSPTLSDSDRVLGSSDLSALDEDQSSQEILSVALNVTPGTYYVGSCVNADVSELDTGNNCAVSAPITVEQTSEPIPITPGLNDAWYNPNTNGQGFFINVFPNSNQVFMSWFTFDTERPPADVTAQLGDPGHRWLTALGTFERGVATLDVFLTTGGVFDAANPPAVTNPVPYGSMIVSFSNCINGEVEFDLPQAGESGTIQIERIVKDNVADCEDQIGAVSSQAAAQSAVSHTEAATGSRSKTQAEGTGSSFNYNPSLNDAWYNPVTDGQGFFINVFPKLGQVFLSWFTFDVTRPPVSTPFNLGEPGHRWLTAQGPFVGDTARLKVYSTSGGVFNFGSLGPENNEQVGTITARFEDCNSGVVSYDIDSVGTGEVPIERTVRDTIPACEQKSKGDEGSTEAVSPKIKQLMANLCGGNVKWSFNWPDEDSASGYIFQLRREDTLATTSWVSTLVKGSGYEYLKAEAVPESHLSGWTWRYRPMFTSLGKKTGSWSEDFTFNVSSLEADPCQAD